MDLDVEVLLISGGFFLFAIFMALIGKKISD